MLLHSLAEHSVQFLHSSLHLTVRKHYLRCFSLLNNVRDGEFLRTVSSPVDGLQSVGHPHRVVCIVSLRTHWMERCHLLNSIIPSSTTHDTNL
ncbi:unnamed protein product [Dicrocoelium dendriticum]|nr:unnamed protein product [Dicrocoelium dendriticum]